MIDPVIDSDRSHHFANIVFDFLALFSVLIFRRFDGAFCPGKNIFFGGTRAKQQKKIVYEMIRYRLAT